jgi:hypothetical protein
MLSEHLGAPSAFIREKEKGKPKLPFFINALPDYWRVST